MERNYSETLNKAKTYFKNIIKEREKYQQKISLELPKRIEIQTLSTSRDNEDFCTVVGKLNRLETNMHQESKNLKISKPKPCKKKFRNHVKPSSLKVESYDLRNINNNAELESSSNTIIESSSLSSTKSQVSISMKISTSSSSAGLNQKCQEACEREKNSFKNSKKSESISTNVEDSQKNIEEVVTTEEHKTSISQQKIIACFDEQLPIKNNFRSKLGIDQKSINVKKENKNVFSNSNTHIYRLSTTIKSHASTAKENKKAVNNKDTSRTEGPKLNIQTYGITSERLTPAKRYLRSKLGINEKNTNIITDTKKPIQNSSTQDGNTSKIETQLPQPESSTKPCTKLNTIGPGKVRQPLFIRPTPKNTENNLKKMSSANENQKKENRPPKSTKQEELLCTKPNIVTSVKPNSQKTNKISIELKKPIILTTSMEELLSKALKIGLKKMNRSDFKDLQLKIKASVQSRNNISGIESIINSEKSDFVSMQSTLESKVSDFQSEMDRRQRQTLNKIQELEKTIQCKKKELMKISKSKNVTLKKNEK